MYQKAFPRMRVVVLADNLSDLTIEGDGKARISTGP